VKRLVCLGVLLVAGLARAERKPDPTMGFQIISWSERTEEHPPSTGIYCYLEAKGDDGIYYHLAIGRGQCS
jgi:hypothetical protein